MDYLVYFANFAIAAGIAYLGYKRLRDLNHPDEREREFYRNNRHWSSRIWD